MSHRMEKVDEFLRQNISLEIHRLFPDQFVSVTKVETSKDLEHAKVWISSVGDVDAFVRELEKSASEIRRGLAQKSTLRVVPCLRFVSDHTSEQAAHIEELIKKAKDEG